MRIKSVVYLDRVEPVYDITVDNEYHNFTLENGAVVHNCISDARIFGISFKNHKDKVKIISACNMGSSEMGEALSGDKMVGAYNNAGAIDPALAARFAVYWKKNYDVKDARSFLNYLEMEKDEGTIDGIVLDYLKTKTPEELVPIMASVEARTLENAESSTRALNQLSKDIKDMRSNKNSSIFRGKVFFNSAFRAEFSDVASTVLNPNEGDLVSRANMCVDFMRKLVSNAGTTWEPAVTNMTIPIDTESRTGQDLLDGIKEVTKAVSDTLMRPMSDNDKVLVEDYMELLLDMADGCSRLDTKVQDDRDRLFEAYVGRDFIDGGFKEYFNMVFGTKDDVEITIEMLKDETLIEKFLDKFYVLELDPVGPEQKVTKCLELIRKFWDVHNNTLPALNYAMFIRGIRKILPTAENMQNVLSHSGVVEDKVLAMAEGVGDNFIMDMLKTYPATFSEKDIANMRKSKTAPKATKRKSRIL